MKITKNVKNEAFFKKRKTKKIKNKKRKTDLKTK